MPGGNDCTAGAGKRNTSLKIVKGSDSYSKNLKKTRAPNFIEWNPWFKLKFSLILRENICSQTIQWKVGPIYFYKINIGLNVKHLRQQSDFTKDRTKSQEPFRYSSI